ncbi:MAG TPA: histidinol-phosphate transaminase [Gemmatimonadales bacterium]|nr:histidinol-phosphate transaminase [Gemmatimonadales bacterium]
MTPTRADALTGPISRVDPIPYGRRQPLGDDVLRLDSNEGPPPPRALLAHLADADPDLLRRYRDAGALEAALATRFGVGTERVIVTSGADEAIDRACRAFLDRGRTLLLPEPTFELFERFAALAGGTTQPVSWPAGPFPGDAFLERLDARTAMIAVVSPNNPTGAVAGAADVRRLASAAPDALLLLDHAYVEYGDHDLTPALLDLPNVLVVRTFSKAWGLAGCRVGYAIGSPYVVSVLRAAGGPYPVGSPSIALALYQLEHGEPALRAHVLRVREERATLAAWLAARGLAPLASQANFVLANFGTRAALVYDGLASLGVLVRDFPLRAGLETALRFTLPGDPAQFQRLCSALETVLS